MVSVGILILFCIAAGILGALIVGVAYFVIGWRRSSRSQIFVGGILFTVSSILVGLYMISYYHSSQPSTIFQYTFGFDVPADVSELEAVYSSFGDSENGFMRFQSSRNTVDRILERGLKKAPSTYFISSNITPPSWWKLPEGEESIRFKGSDIQKNYAAEVEVLIYYPEIDMIYFHWVSID